MKKDVGVDAVKRKRLLLLNGIGIAPRGEGILVVCDGNVNVDDDDDDDDNDEAAAATALTLAAVLVLRYIVILSHCNILSCVLLAEMNINSMPWL